MGRTTAHGYLRTSFGYEPSMGALLLALAIVAGVIAVIELVRSRMTMLIAWGVLALALIPIISAVAG